MFKNQPVTKRKRQRFKDDSLKLKVWNDDFRKTLFKKLKATSGKSTALFIRFIRLQKGKELIETTDKPISEIAYDVGFNDPSYFSRAFKEEFGSAPSALSK